MPSAILPERLRPLILDDQRRYGSANDGGYILPACVLENCRTLLSLGVNLDWCFESDLLRRFPHLRIASFDRTTTLSRAATWGLTRFLYAPISRRPEHFRALMKPFGYIAYTSHPRVTHRARFVGARTEDDTVGVTDVLAALKGAGPIVVKMDIERAEYNVLEQLVVYHEAVTGMAIEFHDVECRQPQFRRLVDACLAHYHVAHVHVNNAGQVHSSGLPDLLEITFIRHDLVPEPTWFQKDEYRLPIDTPNLPEHDDVTIRFSDC